MNRAKPYLVPFLLGALLTLAYAPFGYWMVTPIVLVALFTHYLKQQTTNRFLYGFSFGLGWFGVGISWVHVSIEQFGGLPLIGSVGLMILLCAYLSFFPGLFFYLSGKLFRSAFTVLGVFPLWWFCEWLRGWLLTGFPWLSVGYSQLNGPLAGFIPVLGESGTAALLVFVCALIAWQIKTSTKPKYFALIPALVISLVGYSLSHISWVTESEESANITMVQGNIKQELRWVPEQDLPTINKYQRLTEPNWDSDIIIWPEAAIPRLEPLAQEFLYQLDKKALETDTGLVTGIVNYNFETEQAFNNMIVLGKYRDDQTEGEYRYLHNNRYAKHHLLPIGEFIPLEDWLRGLAPIFNLPMSSFTRGEYLQSNLVVNGKKLVSAICFEIAFPEQIRANLRKDSNYIITVSNDAWFGQSHGPAQHLEIAQVRALEFGIPVIRATNTGLTAFIDASGRLIKTAPQFEDATITADLASTKGITPYRFWGNAINWLISIALSLIVFWKLKAPRGDERS